MIPLILGVLASASLLFWAVCAVGGAPKRMAANRPHDRNITNSGGGEKAGNVIKHGSDNT